MWIEELIICSQDLSCICQTIDLGHNTWMSWPSWSIWDWTIGRQLVCMVKLPLSLSILVWILSWLIELLNSYRFWHIHFIQFQTVARAILHIQIIQIELLEFIQILLLAMLLDDLLVTARGVDHAKSVLHLTAQLEIWTPLFEVFHWTLFLKECEVILTFLAQLSAQLWESVGLFQIALLQMVWHIDPLLGESLQILLRGAQGRDFSAAWAWFIYLFIQRLSQLVVFRHLLLHSELFILDMNLFEQLFQLLLLLSVAPFIRLALRYPRVLVIKMLISILLFRMLVLLSIPRLHPSSVLLSVLSLNLLQTGLMLLFALVRHVNILLFYFLRLLLLLLVEIIVYFLQYFLYLFFVDLWFVWFLFLRLILSIFFDVFQDQVLLASLKHIESLSRTWRWFVLIPGVYCFVFSLWQRELAHSLQALRFLLTLWFSRVIVSPACCCLSLFPTHKRHLILSLCRATVSSSSDIWIMVWALWMFVVPLILSQLGDSRRYLDRPVHELLVIEIWAARIHHSILVVRRTYIHHEIVFRRQRILWLLELLLVDFLWFLWLILVAPRVWSWPWLWIGFWFERASWPRYRSGELSNSFIWLWSRVALLWSFVSWFRSRPRVGLFLVRVHFALTLAISEQFGISVRYRRLLVFLNQLILAFVCICNVEGFYLVLHLENCFSVW